MLNPTLILDLDNTIVGDVTYQVLANILCKKACKVSYIKKMYSEKSGVIRPGFTTLISTLRSKIPNIKIYIYTSSRKEWALKEIKWIEQNCKIKLDRPILSRDDCIDINNKCYKSISKISKKIKNIDKNNLLIIDNNDLFIDNKNNFIKCPSYNYIYFIDLWKAIPIATLDKPDVVTFINKLITEDYMNPYNIKDISLNLEKSIKNLKWFHNKLIKINTINCKNDDFFEIINNIIWNSDIQNLNIIKNQYLKI